MKITRVPMPELKDLIKSQLAAKQKAEAEIKELDVLLLESLGEFHRRVNEPANKEARDE